MVRPGSIERPVERSAGEQNDLVDAAIRQRRLVSKFVDEQVGANANRPRITKICAARPFAAKHLIARESRFRTFEGAMEHPGRSVRAFETSREQEETNH